MKTRSVFALARYIVNKSVQDGEPVTNHGLQQILFCIQSRFLRNGKAAFDEEFEAWKSGPVVPEVYNHLFRFHERPIDSFIATGDEYDMTDAEKAEIDDIILASRLLTVDEVSLLIEQPGGAWSRTYGDGKFYHRIIHKKVIGQVA